MKKFVIIMIIVSAAVGFTFPATAQADTYKYDFGAQLGMSGYLGDANKSSIFKHPGVSAGVSMRYLPENNRWAFRGVMNVLSLSGDTSDFDDYLPNGEHYKFSSQAYELNFRAEFNFMPYGIGETYKHLRRVSPYLALGLGATLSTCDGVTAVAPAVPMAIGVKYKLRERWNLQAEFSMTKVFGDKLDGNLIDLYGIKSSFVKNTDWYSNISVGITYEFGKRCVTCHYVD